MQVSRLRRPRSRVAHFDSSFGEIVSPTQSARRGQVVSAEARCAQYTRIFAQRQGIPTRSRIAAHGRRKRLLNHANLPARSVRRVKSTMNLTLEDVALLKQLKAAGEGGRTIRAYNVRLALDRLAKGGYVVARPTRPGPLSDHRAGTRGSGRTRLVWLAPPSIVSNDREIRCARS